MIIQAVLENLIVLGQLSETWRKENVLGGKVFCSVFLFNTVWILEKWNRYFLVIKTYTELSGFWRSGTVGIF
jgi:hypothetical protein